MHLERQFALRVSSIRIHEWELPLYHERTEPFLEYGSVEMLNHQVSKIIELGLRVDPVEVVENRNGSGQDSYKQGLTKCAGI